MRLVGAQLCWSATVTLTMLFAMGWGVGGVADAMSDKRTEAITGKSSDERQTICAHE